MDKVLTVVIPSYNVESYLEDTLESFVAPEILSEIEVLIVNDGSKDRTPEIAKEYEEKYPGTFRLISKENGGHGSTINRGIEEAVGTYFKVVDGDDWVNTSDFAELVRKLRTTNADYVVTKYYKVNDKTKEKKIVEFPFLEAHPECTFDEAASGSEIPMHALVIRTAILQEHRIRMDEHCFYVDNEYITFPVLILWRCLSAWALPVCGICLKRPRKMRLVSCLLMKLTRWQEDVVLEWAAVMMRESRL